MERGVPGDIYRAGDGVHLVWQKYKYSRVFKRILNPMNYILPKLEKTSLGNSKYIVANSKLIKNICVDHYTNLLESRTFVIYNGYDEKVFKRLSNEEKIKNPSKLEFLGK